MSQGAETIALTTALSTTTGAGESEPVPYFYQNLGEAEYVVATYMFMRLLGYPAHKISILTTYNGQKALLRDVVEQRCAPYAMFGRPHRVGGGQMEGRGRVAQRQGEGGYAAMPLRLIK